MCYETLRVHLGLAHWLPLREIAEMKGLVFDGGSDLMTKRQHVLVLRGSLLSLNTTMRSAQGSYLRLIILQAGSVIRLSILNAGVQVHCVSERGKEQYRAVLLILMLSAEVDHSVPLHQ